MILVKDACIINNEQGSAIIVALLALALVTLLGISSIDTTCIELKIVRNEKMYQRCFYVADSGWKDGACWLEGKSEAPSKINVNPSLSDDELKIVRNFGDGAANVLNDDFPDNSEDDTIDAIPYWYNIQYSKDQIVAGSGKAYREFIYIVKSNANREHEIEVRLKKIYKTGY
jgi:Tfp pilus assembly protein PilX